MTATNARSPRVSVIVCTRNRARLLEGAIASVLAQQLTAEYWELIVVDNASTDTTNRVVEGFGGRVRYVREPTIGLSHARNAGWSVARAEIVAMLDDDAIADPDWLDALLSAFGDHTPTPSCVGGKTTPIWEAPRPPWLTDHLLPALTVADWSSNPHPITDLTREWLVGANLAFQRDELVRLGGFATSLGRQGDRLRSGEEIFLQRKLLDEGRTCLYEPRAHVRHLVAAERLTPAWFYRRLYAQGLSDAAMWHLERERHHERRLHRTVIEARRCLAAGVGWMGRWNDPMSQRVEDTCGVLWQLGFTAGLAGA